MADAQDYLISIATMAATPQDALPRLDPLVRDVTVNGASGASTPTGHFTNGNA